MKSPYMNALNLPAAGLDDPLRKKDTVIGTIGKTQGVSRAANPQRIASNIRPQSTPPFSPEADADAWLAPAAADTDSSEGSVTLKSKYSGCAHIVSEQQVHVTVPSTTGFSPVSVKSCPKTISPKKTGSPK